MDFKRIFTGYWVVPFSWLFLIFFLYSWFGRIYTDESFSLFMLGKNLVSGQGFAINSVRDFYIETTQPWYSRSFAPLFPLLVGIVDKFTSAGVASGLILNLVILFFILHVAYSMSTKVPGARGHFLFLAVLLFICWNQPFMNEVVRGGTYPLFLLLIMCVAHFLTWKRYFKGLSSSICIGALLGLMFLTRFDSIIFCFLFPLTYFFDSKDKLKKTLHAYAGFIVVISPWLVRNVTVFNQIFAYDNWMSVVSIMDESWALSFYKNGGQTFSASPTLWVYQKFSNLIHNTRIFFRQIGIPGLVLLALLIGITVKKIREREPWSSVHLLTGSWLLANIITTTLLPFHESRLFSVSILMLVLSLIHDLIRFGNKSMILKPSMSTKVRIAWAICVSLLIYGVLDTLQKPIHSINPKIKNAYEDVVKNFSESVTTEDMIASTNPETLTYFSNWKTIHIPVNTVEFDENFIAWMKAWNVSHMLIDTDSAQAQKYAFLESKEVKLLKKQGPFHLLDLRPLIAPKKTSVPSKPKQKASSKKT